METTRKVRALDIECPTCGAQPGEDCLTNMVFVPTKVHQGVAMAGGFIALAGTKQNKRGPHAARIHEATSKRPEPPQRDRRKVLDYFVTTPNRWGDGKVHRPPCDFSESAHGQWRWAWEVPEDLPDCKLCGGRWSDHGRLASESRRMLVEKTVPAEQPQRLPVGEWVRVTVTRAFEGRVGASGTHVVDGDRSYAILDPVEFAPGMFMAHDRRTGTHTLVEVQ